MSHKINSRNIFTSIFIVCFLAVGVFVFSGVIIRSVDAVLINIGASVTLKAPSSVLAGDSIVVHITAVSGSSGSNFVKSINLFADGVSTKSSQTKSIENTCEGTTLSCYRDVSYTPSQSAKSVTLSAVATFTNGQKATSNGQVVTIAAGMPLAITVSASPNPVLCGATSCGTSIITVTATDGTSNLSKISLVDSHGLEITTAKNCSIVEGHTCILTAPISYPVKGMYNFVATAFNAAGKSASASVGVQFGQNAAPEIKSLTIALPGVGEIKSGDIGTIAYNDSSDLNLSNIDLKAFLTDDFGLADVSVSFVKEGSTNWVSVPGFEKKSCATLKECPVEWNAKFLGLGNAELDRYGTYIIKVSVSDSNGITASGTTSIRIDNKFIVLMSRLGIADNDMKDIASNMVGNSVTNDEMAKITENLYRAKLKAGEKDLTVDILQQIKSYFLAYKAIKANLVPDYNVPKDYQNVMKQVLSELENFDTSAQKNIKEADAAKRGFSSCLTGSVWNMLGVIPGIGAGVAIVNTSNGIADYAKSEIKQEIKNTMENKSSSLCDSVISYVRKGINHIFSKNIVLGDMRFESDIVKQLALTHYKKINISDTIASPAAAEISSYYYLRSLGILSKSSDIIVDKTLGGHFIDDQSDKTFNNNDRELLAVIAKSQGVVLLIKNIVPAPNNASKKISMALPPYDTIIAFWKQQSDLGLDLFTSSRMVGKYVVDLDAILNNQ